MLEPSSNFVSKEVSAASCEEESKWIYNLMQIVNLSNKRQIEGEEEVQSRKATKPSDPVEKQGTMEALNVIAAEKIEKPDNQHPTEGLHAVSNDFNPLRDRIVVEARSESHSPVKHERQEMALSIVLTDQSNKQQQQLAGSVPDVQTNKPINQFQLDDQSDLSILIHPLGRELSISCLLHCSRSDYGSIAMLNKSFHSLVRSGLLYQLRKKMGIVEHWVYFSCNILVWEAFDLLRGRWMSLPRMPSNECFMCSDKESLGVGTELLVFGKEIMSHVIYKYSILTNTWTIGMEMNIPRCLFGSASLGDIAILAGGCDPCGRIVDSAELYDSETGRWMIIPSMNNARKMCSAVFMDGKFYVIGGVGKGNKYVTCGEEYDLKTKSWRVIPDMSPAQNRGVVPAAEAPPLVAVAKNELYAADYAQQVVKKYDKLKNVWITLGKLPTRVDSMNGWGIAFRACGDRLIVLGGPRSLGEGMVDIHSWVPGEGTPTPHWKLLGRKSSGSFVYNCAVMGC